jgi:hypothetical protein
MWWHTVTYGRGSEGGKLANAVGSQYSSHYLGTRCIQHYYRWCRTLRLPAVDWTDAPHRVDLNGLGPFVRERRNLVSARVPSFFVWPLPTDVVVSLQGTSGINVGIKKVKWSRYRSGVWPRGWVEVWLKSSMTAALEGGEWSAARPGRTLHPGKTLYPSDVWLTVHHNSVWIRKTN